MLTRLAPPHCPHGNAKNSNRQIDIMAEAKIAVYARIFTAVNTCWPFRVCRGRRQRNLFFPEQDAQARTRDGCAGLIIGGTITLKG